MIKVSNTNGTGKYKTAVRVYRNGVLVGEVFPTARNPLAYLKKYTGSKYNKQLIEQLVLNGLTDDEIREVYA
jgi:hypothetical protein